VINKLELKSDSNLINTLKNSTNTNTNTNTNNINSSNLSTNNLIKKRTWAPDILQIKDKINQANKSKGNYYIITLNFFIIKFN